MINSIEAMDLPYVILSKDHKEAIGQMKNAVNISKELLSPYFVVVRKNTFDSYPVDKLCSGQKLSRENAIMTSAQMVPEDGLVVCTTGMASRELFEFRANNKQAHDRDFLTVGGMGHANQIALGLCKSQPERNVFCFDGDGAALMHMGSLAIIGQSGALNLIHMIFNNGVHDSVGGQPTVALDIDFCKIAHACGYPSVIKVNTTNEIKKSINSEIKSDGPHLIEVRVKPGNRNNIGRPTSPPLKNKLDFMDNLGTNLLV